MINDDYHGLPQPPTNTSFNIKNENELEQDYYYLHKIHRYGLIEDIKELIHEHIFEEDIVKALTPVHNCNAKLIHKCTTCNYIYCSHCGRLIDFKGFISV